MRRAGESSSFLRRAARFDLGSLPSYEVEEAVRITIESAGRTISQPALDAAVQAIGGLGSGNAPALPQPRARARLRGGFGAGSRGGVREGRPARCELNGSSRLSAVDARHIRGLSTVESTILGPPACLCASSRRILGAGTVDSTPIRPVFAKTASTRGTLGSPNAGNRRLELHKGLLAAWTCVGGWGWREPVEPSCALVAFSGIIRRRGGERTVGERSKRHPNRVISGEEGPAILDNAVHYLSTIG